ncbi:MAG: HAMP domain-containing protein, partial [Gammaproteobacteria bacterium]|nr:HAMP domain-containing protein [Gammaproteobacteria bacterium]
MSWLTNAGVGKKIAAGFAVLALIMIATVIIALGRINESQVINTRVFELRTPTVLASTNMLNGINHSLAALRGYMILGADKFKAGRQKSWETIDSNYAKMQEFSKSWTNPDNVQRLNEMGAVLGEFKQAQQEIEDISGTIDNTPATRILVTEAAPLTTIMVKEITNMINLEAKEAATRERKALLGMMADTRGTTGLALANIRAFLLTGDEKFHKNFEGFWTKNEKRFGDLSKNTRLLTSKQRASYNKFKAARDEFKGLPPKMFEIRGSKQWNLANAWLGTKAAPRANKLVSTLNGMVKNQNKLAFDDIALAEQTGHDLKNFMMLLGVISVLIAIAVAFFVVRMITKPVASAATGLKQIAEGDLTQRYEVNSSDELGNMLSDMNQMADSLSGIVTEVINGTTAISEAANEVSRGNADLSQRTEEQASSLEETASSMEEMTSTVKQNADNASQANQLAAGARTQAEKGGEVVGSAVTAMAEINASSKKIADIISVIDEIAFQ